MVRAGCLGTTKSTSESGDLSKTRHLIVFLKVAKLADHARIIRKGNDRVNPLPSIRPRLNGWDALGENLRMKVLVLFAPCAGLLRSTTISRATLGEVGKQTKSPSSGRSVTRKAKKDRGLVSAVEGGKEVPARVRNNLSKLVGDTRAWSFCELRQGLTVPPRRQA